MNYHLVGIGGIGMSGLAQLLHSQGHCVSGSDRGVGLPENEVILKPLEASGIKLYKQDGSYIADGAPDALIYSTAIEEDNPDFVNAPNSAPRIHRSRALEEAMSECGNSMIAVTGSCGKTSVSAWLAETMFLMDLDPGMVSGGLVNRFKSEKLAGNFRPGDGEYTVFEADESDKSLTAFHPDYSVILNIGTDHYSKEELIEVFQKCLLNTKRGVVIEKSLIDDLGGMATRHLEVKTFSIDDPEADWFLSDYHIDHGTVIARFNDLEAVKMPAPGRYVAANALAVLATIDMLGFSTEEANRLVGEFRGVWRRFNFAGTLKSGAYVYDDYAHNVEKICSSINAAKEITTGRVFAVFQPHGFGPLNFMKDELLNALERSLSADDEFCFLPVFYAGGTTSFKPTSEEVVNEYKNQSEKQFNIFSDRKEAEIYLNQRTKDGDTIVIMGARDNSLSTWATEVSTL